MSETSPATSPAQREFRAAMANLSAAVSVVTTDGPLGRAGMTVSSACSVTDAPPTVLVCVNRSARSHAVLLAGGRLCLNVLGAGQEGLARHFAGATGVPTGRRFDEGGWDLDTHGVPVLRGALCSVVGRVVADQALGSHSVLFVEVDEVVTAAGDAPLVYFRRRFHHLATS